MAIIDYTTVATSSLGELDRAVKDHINQGWQPQGGLAVNTFEENGKIVQEFFQALVKYEEE